MKSFPATCESQATSLLSSANSCLCARFSATSSLVASRCMFSCNRFPPQLSVVIDACRPLLCSQQVSPALFFKYNTALGPPYQVLVDTNFINFSIQNKVKLATHWLLFCVGI
jgi:hypothetical protein